MVFDFHCVSLSPQPSQVKAPILNAGLGLQAAVLSIHLVGGLLGYFVPKTLGYGETTCRTMAIETSMKSSAFGACTTSMYTRVVVQS